MARAQEEEVEEESPWGVRSPRERPQVTVSPPLLQLL